MLSLLKRIVILLVVMNQFGLDLAWDDSKFFRAKSNAFISIFFYLSIKFFFFWMLRH